MTEDTTATEPEPAVGDDTHARTACHKALLFVAGRAPDDLLTTCREWVAQGRTLDVARAVTFAALTYRVPLLEDDLLAVADLLASGGVDPAVLQQADVATADTPPPFLFDDGTESAPGTAAVSSDDLAAAAVQVVEEVPAARGLWRARRTPADGSPWPAPRPVHVLEVGADGDPVAAAAALGTALRGAGDVAPQIEVYTTGQTVPTYLQLARAAGTLLWAATPDTEPSVASVFNHVDEDGVPSFADDHPRIEDEGLRAEVVAFLDAGEVLMTTTSLGTDYVDPERGEVVPMTFRTDGTWIWTDALTYYVREHGLRPQEDLMSHIASAPAERHVVDGVDVYRAMRVLTG